MSNYSCLIRISNELLLLSQPVRTFFHTNKSTCAEWLSRIRLIIVMVSLHAGLSTTAIRHGYCLLQDMAQAGNTKVSFKKSYKSLIYV